MSKKNVHLLLSCCTAWILLATGCANKAVVKTGQPVDTAKSTLSESATTKKPQPAHEKTSQADPAEMKSSHTAVEAEKAKAAKSSALQGALQKIYFDYDRSDLSKEAREVLFQDAEILKGKSGAKVTIEGNCDERGSAEYNLALGERRAKAAKQYLVALGIPSEKLKTISYGKEKPAVQGSDEAAWAKNRRDEFVIQQ